MNLVLALVAGLQADAGVAALAGTDVYDFELPTTEDFIMPIPVVVIRPNAGPKNYQMLELNVSRVSVVCYGETPNLAYTLYSAVYAALKGWTPSVFAHTYIHSVNEESGPIPMRDPQLQWPYTISQWQVLASDLTISP